MQAPELLAELEELARELGLPVRRMPARGPYDELVPAQSGVCVLRGQRSVWLSPADPPERQIAALARALREHAGPSLEMRFLPPAIRDCLERSA
jgi:hypothetical protein